MRGTRATAQCNALGDNLEPGEVSRVAMKLPADQARNALALLDARALEDPVVRLGDDPVPTAVEGRNGARAHQ